MTQLGMQSLQAFAHTLLRHTRLLRDGLCLRLQCPSPLRRLLSFLARPANNKTVLTIQPLSICAFSAFARPCS